MNFTYNDHLPRLLGDGFCSLVDAEVDVSVALQKGVDTFHHCLVCPKRNTNWLSLFNSFRLTKLTTKVISAPKNFFIESPHASNM